MRAIIKQKCPGAFSANILFKPKKNYIKSHAQLVFLFSSWVQGCKEENEYEKYGEKTKQTSDSRAKIHEFLAATFHESVFTVIFILANPIYSSSIISIFRFPFVLLYKIIFFATIPTFVF